METVDWKVALSDARDHIDDIHYLNQMRIRYMTYVANVLQELSVPVNIEVNNKQVSIEKLSVKSDGLRVLRFVLILSGKLSFSSASSEKDYDTTFLDDVLDMGIMDNLMGHLCRTEVGEYCSTSTHTKCSVLAAKLFSNLFTLCGNILPKAIPFSSDQFVSMISTQGSLGNRDAVAAIVAALYNFICKQPQFSLEISRDKLLIANLCRYLLPVRKSVHECNDSLSDEATEWITKVLYKIFQLGMLRQMYASVSGGNECTCTLEQVVLMSCIYGEVESEEIPLMENIGNPKEYFESMLVFLTNEAVRLHTVCDRLNNITDSLENSYNGENLSTDELFIVIIDIISSILIKVDDLFGIQEGSRLRLCISHQKSLIETVIVKLKQKTDEHTADLNHKSVREVGKSMNESDQRLFTTLLRFIANLSYKCKFVQDSLREWKDKSIVALQTGQETQNGLHVILSTTSLSFASFGIREWTIVAIRNALDNNKENQDIVDTLRAQAAVNTPELENMGIKVGIDQRGKVKVSTVEQ